MLSVFGLYMRMFSRYYYFRSPHSQEEVLRILGNVMIPEKVPTEERQALLHEYSPREYEGCIEGDTFWMKQRLKIARANAVRAGGHAQADDSESWQSRHSMRGRVIPDDSGSIVVFDGEYVQVFAILGATVSVIVVCVELFGADTASIWEQLLLLVIGAAIVYACFAWGWSLYEDSRNLIVQLCDANEVHGKFVLPQAENV